MRSRRTVCVLAIVAAFASSGEGARQDIDGHPLNPFKPAGVASVIFFVATDCPISNSYAPEIQRVCQDYGPRGVACSLVYEDVDIGVPGRRLEEDVRDHLRDYRYRGIPAVIDRSRTIAQQAKASVTPQAVVVDRDGTIRYRGRIDNFYAALGKPRQRVTEHNLRDALDAVLAGTTVPKIETQPVGCYIVDPAWLRK
jgi:thiol-disulfide isomerase/thioredoxin